MVVVKKVNYYTAINHTPRIDDDANKVFIKEKQSSNGPLDQGHCSCQVQNEEKEAAVNKVRKAHSTKSAKFGRISTTCWDPYTSGEHIA